MSLRKILLGRGWFGGGALASLALFGAVTVSAQEAPVMITCGSTQATLGQAFTMTPDQSVSLVCSLKNTSATALSVMLSGSMLSPGQFQPSGAGAMASLEGNTTAEATLFFGQVFRTGTYTFTVTALDMMTGQSVGNKATLTGTLGSATAPQQVQILSASLDKGEYQWGDVFSLDLMFDVPEGQSLADTPVTVVMQKGDGQPCSTLVEKRPLTEAQTKLSLTFPKEAGECVNALGVMLHSKDGQMVDKRMLAVGLVYGDVATGQGGTNPKAEQGVTAPQSGMSALTISILVFVIVFVVVFGVVFVGYVMVQRKKRSVI